MAGKTTVAEMVAATLSDLGVKRMFGVPGGGSSLDLIEQGARRGIDFVLARAAAGAGIMAAATAELTGVPGVFLTTKGPGVSAAANALAQCSLDRTPVIYFSDGFAAQTVSWNRHQYFDQRAMTAPLCNGYGRLESEDPTIEFAALVDAALTAPRGPVHVDLNGSAAQGAAELPPAGANRRHANGQLEGDVAAARILLERARRPLVAVGLEVTDPDAVAATRALVDGLDCPVLCTYKGKGVLSDDDPRMLGILTGGALEAKTLDACDLLVLVGLDPIELISKPWAHDMPVLSLGLWPHAPNQIPLAAGLYGDLSKAVHALRPAASAGDWTAEEMAALRDGMRAGMRIPEANGGLSPSAVVEATLENAPEGTRATVDAGAHMFAAMALWPAREPGDVLISNGLASMAFALPAAIAVALEQPDRPVVAFTGDGGLLMCLGELETAARTGCNLTVVVFNDGALSLIDLKQQARQLPPRGCRWDRPDFAASAAGLGLMGRRAASAKELATALREATAHPGPALIDVIVDPSGYGEQSRRLRG
ncbi:MAG: thiamine pyrophosphate-binding protein [Acetobacterales bacterium]